MRIGVLGNEGSWYVRRICDAATERGHAAVELRFSDQCPEIIGGKTSLRIGEHEALDLDVLIVRTMPPGSLEQVVSRMDFLATAESLGVKVLNSAKAIECAVDKYLTTQKLAIAGVSVPDTIVCENSDAALVAYEALGGDVVVKPLFGAEGRGILRVSHPEMALRTFKTLERLNASIYLQKYLSGPREDIRILLLGSDVVAAMKRRPVKDEFRANVAQSGVAQRWIPTNAEVAVSVRAAETTNCVFCGVDLMYNEFNELQVIEVNAVPGWRTLEKTSGVNVSEKLIKWLEADGA